MENEIKEYIEHKFCNKEIPLKDIKEFLIGNLESREIDMIVIRGLQPEGSFHYTRSQDIIDKIRLSKEIIENIF